MSGKLSRRPWDSSGTGGWSSSKPATGAIALKANEVARLWIGVGDETTPGDLSALAGLNHDDIYKLVLFSDKVTNEGMAYIKDLTSLQELEIALADIDDDGLMNLRRLRNLEKLTLSGFNVTDEILEVISVITTLKVLDLKVDTNVWDSGVVRLIPLKNLETLVLDPKNLTNISLTRLQNALPDCDISPKPSQD